jgi:hypothetical protein
VGGQEEVEEEEEQQQDHPPLTFLRLHRCNRHFTRSVQLCVCVLSTQLGVWVCCCCTCIHVWVCVGVSLAQLCVYLVYLLHVVPLCCMYAPCMYDAHAGLECESF